MNKIKLVAKIAERTEMTKKDTEKMLIAFQDVVKELLTNGEKISLSGFGTFEIVERASRIGRNPKTNETIQIAASKSPKFKPAKALKDVVNGR